MNETIFVTGAGSNGVTGRLIKENFQSRYIILSPGSHELDLTDSSAVNKYFVENKIDYVIHCATFRVHSNIISHLYDELLESNLRMYYNLAAQSAKYKKMIYLGSGAEYNKSLPIIDIREEDFGKTIPFDKYGMGKYIMNIHAKKSPNIYNLRIFGTINAYERYEKNIISNFCAKAVLDIPLTIRKDCRFSFLDMDDLLPIIDWMLISNPQFHDYNVCLSKSFLLTEMAAKVIACSNKKLEIQILDERMNLEYSGNSNRLSKELNEACEFSDIDHSVKKVYDYFNSWKEQLIYNDVLNSK